MVLGFWDIAVPIVGAPMAGGPGTPALAAAVSNAGGLGFIPSAYLSAERFAEDIGDCLAGQVVFRWSQTTARDDDIRPIEGSPKGVRQTLSIVANLRHIMQIETQSRELLG